MRFYLMLILMIFLSSQLFSQDRSLRFVSVQAEEMKESASNFSRTLGSLSMGDQTSLVSEDGRWSHVRTETLTGWVRSSSITSRRVLPAGTSTATAAEIALAGKGFSPDIEIEYRRTGMDYSLVDLMENTVISPQELLNFIREGRLNRGE